MDQSNTSQINSQEKKNTIVDQEVKGFVLFLGFIEFG